MPSPRLDSRVLVLETDVRSLGQKVQGLDDSIQSLNREVATRLTLLGDQINAARRTDWPTLISGSFFVMALFGGGIAPLYMMTTNLKEQVGQALGWQYSYVRGEIPSSAEPKLAAIDKMFTEVETQFRSFKERMIENEQLTGARSTENMRHIEENRAEIRRLSDAVARIEERTAIHR